MKKELGSVEDRERGQRDGVTVLRKVGKEYT